MLMAGPGIYIVLDGYLPILGAPSVQSCIYIQLGSLLYNNIMMVKKLLYYIIIV